MELAAHRRRSHRRPPGDAARHADGHAPGRGPQSAQGVYHRRGRLVLFEDINFQVKRQEMLAIVGQSGAGKSTFCTYSGRLIRHPRVKYTSPQHSCDPCPPMRQRTFAIARSATSGSFTICCRSLQPLKTSRFPFWREVSQKKRHCRKPCTGLTRWDWQIGRPIVRASFPAGSSSESRWRAR